MNKGPMHRRFLAASMMTLWAFLAQIGLSNPQKTEIKIENGITIVHNAKKPASVRGRPLQLILEEDLTIGINEKESGYFFEDIGIIRAADDGTIYVLDRKAFSIKVFDKSGKYLKSFGRQGQGPGEFGPPNAMHIIAGKEVMVSSFSRLSYFSLQGDFLRQIPAMFWGPPVPDSEGNIIAATNAPAGGIPKFATEIKKFNSKLEPVFLIHRYEYIMPPDGTARSPFSTLLLYAVQKDDSIVWGMTDQYVLTVINKSGQTMKKILKDYDPIRIKEEGKQNILRDRAPGSKYLFPDYYPPFRYLNVDDEGRVFVRTYETDKDGSRFYDVFDSEGRYIAKIILKNAPFFWKNRNLYCVNEDTEGYQQAKRYRVTWK